MILGFLRARLHGSSSITIVPYVRYYCAAAEKTVSTIEPKTMSMDSIWSLWNEGNLFSLSIPELQAFLKSQKVDVAGEEKKTALVRKVEDLMSKEQPSLVRAEETAVVNLFDGEGNSGSGDLYDESDLYGDWGQDAGLTQHTELTDAVQMSLSATSNVPLQPLDVRAVQVLHEVMTPDVGIARLDTSKLPGRLANVKAFTFTTLNPYESNRNRFRTAFAWGVMNMWNLGFEGNINVTYGRTLFNHRVQLFKRSILPLWSVQKSMGAGPVSRFVSLAHERNTKRVNEYLSKNEYTADQEAVTSFLVAVKRMRDPLVLELNSELQPTNVLRTWDRALVSHNVRLKMPDVRFMLRGRTPLKKRIATPFFESEILRFKQEQVESVLAPELGEVQYVAERVISTWMKDIGQGVTLRIMQVKRKPVLSTRDVDQGDRLEYEIDAMIPPQQEGFDLHELAGKVFDEACALAKCLEPGMVSYKANSVASLEDV